MSDLLDMRFHPFLFSCILGLFLVSCSSGNDTDLREQVIQEKLEERVEKYKSEKRNACNKKVLKAAGAIADSILLVEARLKRDTSGKPLIPEKPELPEIVPIIDTLPVKPFFRDSSLELMKQDSTKGEN